MAHGTVLKGGWRWSGRSYSAGDPIEASEAQIASWARSGYVQPVKVAPRRETATATAPRENAAEVKDRAEHVGGGWYELPSGERVRKSDIPKRYR